MSADPATIESMFEDMPGPGSDPEVIARFDELFERRHPSKTPESAALLDRICAAARAENRAAAAQLDAIGDLFGYRLARCSENEDWAIDTMEAVAAEVAAALRISQGLAASRLRYARALRERLPKVADIFHAGQIDYRMFQTDRVAHRSDHRPRRAGRRARELAHDEIVPSHCVPRRRPVRRREQKFAKCPLT